LAKKKKTEESVDDTEKYFEENLRAFFEAPIENWGKLEPDRKESELPGECPQCGKALDPGVVVCECGSEFVPEDHVIESEITEFFDELAKTEPVEEPPQLEVEDAPVEKVEFSRERVRRDRILFYVGAVLIFVGGPLIALNSWLHDLFRVPIIGDSYEVFGWLNIFFAAVGFMIFFVGLVIFVLSLRGGVINKEEYEELSA
jgi:hypothetical protein